MTDPTRDAIKRLLAETQALLNCAVEVGQRPTDAKLQERFARLVTERDTLERILRDPDWPIPY